MTALTDLLAACRFPNCDCARQPRPWCKAAGKALVAKEAGG